VLANSAGARAMAGAEQFLVRFGKGATMINLETERLVIRNLLAEDWQRLLEIAIQAETSEYWAYDYPWPTTEEEIKRIASDLAGNDGFIAVCLKSTAEFIGFISLTRNEQADGVEYDLGYRFHAAYHGRGYATEGCRAVLDYAFDALAADRVTSGTAEANLPSRRLQHRLGFRKTGESVVSFRNTPEGEPIEFVGYSFEITREEWQKRKREG
jgi:ribosomal-protein-alanine N-acetyltransferase